MADVSLASWAEALLGHLLVGDRAGACHLRISTGTRAAAVRDFDPAVTRIIAQPFLIRASIDRRMRKHVPDYLLLTDDGPVVVDVKPRKVRRNRPTPQPKADVYAATSKFKSKLRAQVQRVHDRWEHQPRRTPRSRPQRSRDMAEFLQAS